MRITVKVKANSKINAVEEQGDGLYIIRTKSPAIEGRANKAVIELLSEHLSIPKSRIEIKSGHKSKNKIVTIF